MKVANIFFVAALLAGIAAFAAPPPGFTGDYDAALKRSAETKKPILAVFSGSDWCYWCKKLDAEFLSQEKFTKNVTNDLVLLYVDLPRDRSRIGETAYERNRRLVLQYHVAGFPSLMFLDANGSKLGDAQRQNLDPDTWAKYLVGVGKALAK